MGPVPPLGVSKTPPTKPSAIHTTPKKLIIKQQPPHPVSSSTPSTGTGSVEHHDSTALDNNDRTRKSDSSNLQSGLPVNRGSNPTNSVAHAPFIKANSVLSAFPSSPTPTDNITPPSSATPPTSQITPQNSSLSTVISSHLSSSISNDA